MPSRGLRAWIASAFALGLGAILTSAPPAPQTAPQQQPPVFRSAVDVVSLDVSVLDKARRPVHGLSAADFTIAEDGKPQSIVAATEVWMPEALATPPVWARAVPPDVASTAVDGKRFLVIAVSAGGFARPASSGRGGGGGGSVQTVTVGSGESVQRIITGILSRIGPEDLVAIVGGGMSQPFTNDLEKLYGALERLNPSAPPLTPDEMRTRPMARGGGLGLLRDLAEYLTAVPDRRKAIIYITGGSLITRDSSATVDETLWLAQLGNVNIYTINPFGFSGRPGESRRFDLPIELAERTGGVAITNSREIEAGLDSLFLENGSYYLLGYRTSNVAMDGKFRRLDVKVRGRPDVLVRARRQIFRPKGSDANGATPAAVPSDVLRAARMGLLPNLDVGFDVAAMPFAQPGKREVALPMAIAIAEPAPAGAQRVTQRLNVRALVYDERGDLRGQTNLPVPFDAAPGNDRTIRYEVLTKFALLPGRYSVRIVAQNAQTDKHGAIEFSVSVPDFARDTVSISGLALHAESDDAPLGAAIVEGLLPIVPTARRGFEATDRATVFARVYQGGEAPLERVTLDARILDARGLTVLNRGAELGPDRFDAQRSCDWRISLPLDRLLPGHYLLTLQASLGTRHSPKRDLRFSLR